MIAAGITVQPEACLVIRAEQTAGGGRAKACFSFAETPLLTEALRNGREDAFEWLHQQWNMRLYRYCFVLARGDGTLANEILQATYLRLFRHIRALPTEAALWNWMARAARNAASDLRRTQGRYQGFIGRFKEWVESFTSAEEIEESQEEALPAILDQALATLEASERALIEARYFQRASLDEIANQFGTSPRAIEGRLARLRKKIRHLITLKLTQNR